jgi:hypothetical protein
MSWIFIAIAIIIAGWLIANAINPPRPLSENELQDKNAEKIRNNARQEANKLIYQLALKQYTDEQIIADPSVKELIKLEYFNYPLGEGMKIDDLLTQMTINLQKRSASYFMTNKVLLKRLSDLFSKDYDDAKIAKEFCRLEGLKQKDENYASHMPGYHEDEYHAHDITRMKVDPHLKAAIGRLK